MQAGWIAVRTLMEAAWFPCARAEHSQFLMHFALRAILWRPHGLSLGMHPDGLSVDVRLGVLSLGVQRGRTPEELKLRWACQCQAQWIELRCEAQWLERRRVS